MLLWLCKDNWLVSHWLIVAEDKEQVYGVKRGQIRSTWLPLVNYLSLHNSGLDIVKEVVSTFDYYHESMVLFLYCYLSDDFTLKNNISVLLPSFLILFTTILSSMFTSLYITLYLCVKFDLCLYWLGGFSGLRSERLADQEVWFIGGH